jgi:hypothetical protein
MATSVATPPELSFRIEVTDTDRTFTVKETGGGETDLWEAFPISRAHLRSRSLKAAPS